MWRPTETIVCGHPGLPAIKQQCILYLVASQWACDVILSRELSNDCFWLVNTANDGRIALPVCSDTATPVATSRQILNGSNVLWRYSDWPESSCKVAQTGWLDGRVALQLQHCIGWGVYYYIKSQMQLGFNFLHWLVTWTGSLTWLQCRLTPKRTAVLEASSHTITKKIQYNALLIKLYTWLMHIWWNSQNCRTGFPISSLKAISITISIWPVKTGTYIIVRLSSHCQDISDSTWVSYPSTDTKSKSNT